MGRYMYTLFKCKRLVGNSKLMKGGTSRLFVLSKSAVSMSVVCLEVDVSRRRCTVTFRCLGDGDMIAGMDVSCVSSCLWHASDW